MVVSHAVCGRQLVGGDAMQLSRKPVAVALTVTIASNFWPGSSVPTFHTSGLGPLFCAGTALTKVTPLASVSFTTTFVRVKFWRL